MHDAASIIHQIEGGVVTLRMVPSSSATMWACNENARHVAFTRALLIVRVFFVLVFSDSSVCVTRSCYHSDTIDSEISPNVLFKFSYDGLRYGWGYDKSKTVHWNSETSSITSDDRQFLPDAQVASRASLLADVRWNKLISDSSI